MDLNQHIKNLIGSKLSLRTNPDKSITILSTDSFIIDNGNIGYSPTYGGSNLWQPVSHRFDENKSYPFGFYASLIACDAECRKLNDANKVKFTACSHPVGTTPGAIDDYFTWYARMTTRFFRVPECVISDHPVTYIPITKKQRRYKIESVDQHKATEYVIINGNEIRFGVGFTYVLDNGVQVASIPPGFCITELE